MLHRDRGKLLPQAPWALGTESRGGCVWEECRGRLPWSCLIGETNWVSKPLPRATRRASHSETPIPAGGRPRRRRPDESWVRPRLRIRSPGRLHSSEPPRPGCSTWRPPTARPQARLPTRVWVRLPASVLSTSSGLRFSPRPRTWLWFERVRHGWKVRPVGFRPRSRRSAYRNLSQHRARLLHQRKGTTPRPPRKR